AGRRWCAARTTRPSRAPRRRPRAPLARRRPSPRWPAGKTSKGRVAEPLLQQLRQLADLFRRRSADTLVAGEAPTATVVLAAGLAVPELPRRLGIDRCDEEAERCDPVRVDDVIGDRKSVV